MDISEIRTIVNLGSIRIKNDGNIKAAHVNSINKRVPDSDNLAAGFNPIIACCMDLIPREQQQLSISLYDSYTPESVEQIKKEIKLLQLVDPDWIEKRKYDIEVDQGWWDAVNSETAWWLSASSLCLDTDVNEYDFLCQIEEFKRLVLNDYHRYVAAIEELKKLEKSFHIVDGIAVSLRAGGMQAAYVNGHPISVMPYEGLWIVGTYYPSLEIPKDFKWSSKESGPIGNNKQFVRCKDFAELANVLTFAKKIISNPPATIKSAPSRKSVCNNCGKEEKPNDPHAYTVKGVCKTKSQFMPLYEQIKKQDPTVVKDWLEKVKADKGTYDAFVKLGMDENELNNIINDNDGLGYHTVGVFDMSNNNAYSQMKVKNKPQKEPKLDFTNSKPSDFSITVELVGDEDIHVSINPVVNDSYNHRIPVRDLFPSFLDYLEETTTKGVSADGYVYEITSFKVDLSKFSDSGLKLKQIKDTCACDLSKMGFNVTNKSDPFAIYIDEYKPSDFYFCVILESYEKEVEVWISPSKSVDTEGYIDDGFYNYYKICDFPDYLHNKMEAVFCPKLEGSHKEIKQKVVEDLTSLGFIYSQKLEDIVLDDKDDDRVAIQVDKITSEYLKKEIVKLSTLDFDHILNQFAGDDSEKTSEFRKELMDAVSKAKNWKRKSKEKVNQFSEYPQGTIERVFDCSPLEDQLRAYVYTNESDTSIIKIEIQGE